MNYTSKNITAPQNIKRLTAIGLPIRNIFTSLISLFLLSFFCLNGYAQHISNGRSAYELKSNTLSNNTGKSAVSKTLATITSTGTGGLWSDPNTWVNGVVPTASEDVIIENGTTVTVDAGPPPPVCLSLTINSGGTLTFNPTINLDVNGNWTNNGTFNASTGSVTFKGATNNTISGSSASAFNNIIVDKGTEVTSVIEANGVGLSNTGNITITSGLFKMTNGTFQFKSNPNSSNSAGFWVNGATLNSIGSFSYDNTG